MCEVAEVEVGLTVKEQQVQQCAQSSRAEWRTAVNTVQTPVSKGKPTTEGHAWNARILNFPWVRWETSGEF